MTFVLSRYACIRADGGRLVAETASGEMQVTLDRNALALIAAVTTPRSIDEAAAQTGLDRADVERVANVLVAAGVLVSPQEHEAEIATAWSFHDRLFHTRTRPADRSAWDPTQLPPPALPERPWEYVVELERPDVDALERNDAPLAQVQAARTSQRRYSEAPMSARRLAEFLFRVGRVDDVWEAGGVTYAGRPYPSAGGLYELELYLAVDACAGIEPGLYHYSAEHHRLAAIPAGDAEVARLLDDAAAGMGVTARPHVVLVIAARFPRIATKYGPLAYSLVLKNVGVLMQTMYLAATAMGLAGCAVGGGDASVFAAATGLPVEDETSVGEFALGEPRA